MPFSLTMEFPMGFFQGHDAAGEPERYPAPSRAYSALVAAAFGADLPEIPLAAALEAVSWMEGNPPDAVSLPHAVPSWTQRAVAYREKGLSSSNSKTKRIRAEKKGSGRASQISALDGPVILWWHIAPSPVHVRVLSVLAEEIPYIGERESVARVSVQLKEEISLDALPVSKNQLLPDREALRFEYPEVGRLQELKEAYAATRPKRLPNERYDFPGSNEVEKNSPAPRTRTGVARYRLPSRVVADAPWVCGFLVGITREPGESSEARERSLIEPQHYVSWCVALHRAIVKQIGWSVPAIITGKYGEGIERPANHMAIQILPRGVVPGDGSILECELFAIMFPPEATAGEIELVRLALASVRHLYLGKLGRLSIGSPVVFDPVHFWSPVRTGWKRWWEPYPAAICEIRGGQTGPYGGKWTVSDALSLAVGFVWRDKFSITGLKGLSLYQEIVRNVGNLGAIIQQGRKVHFRNIASYVHRNNIPDVLTAATGLLDLYPFCHGTELVAIGQSRHLGGGLLIPNDRPEFMRPLEEGA